MQAKEVLAWLERRGTRRNVEGMARYGITAKKAFGVPMGAMLALAKKVGKDHALAVALWKTGWYEARTLAALVEEPKRVTRGQMNAWAADFDNWGICDTVCFHLFDKVPFAYERACAWASSKHEFVKRAAFALMASLALHDKPAPDAQFRSMLPLIEKGAADERNFVKKGVSWALRSVGRRNPALREAALKLAERLARSDEPAARWVGKDAVRDLTRAKARAEARAETAGRARKAAPASR